MVSLPWELRLALLLIKIIPNSYNDLTDKVTLLISRLNNLPISNFIWNNKRPKLRLSLLYLSYDGGGLQLPNLKWYYWAAQFRAGMFYFERNHTPMWVSIETNLLAIPINLDIYSASKKKLLRQTKNPFLKNTFMVLHNVLAFLGETTSLS